MQETEGHLDQDQTHEPAGSDATSIPLLLEALLFVADAPVSVDRLAGALQVTVPDVDAGLLALERGLAARGIRLQRTSDLVQLVTAPEVSAVVERFLGLDSTVRLSSAALETLAVITYRQPVTRAQIESVRGVNSDRAVATLLAHGLVEEVGRLDAAGRPALFGTTTEFLEHFGLPGLDILPVLEPTQLDKGAEPA